MSLAPIHLGILADSLVLSGHDAAAALHLAGLQRADLAPSAPWLGEDDLDRFMLACLAVSGDPAWAFVASGSSALTRYGPHAVVIGHAPTLRHALHDMHAFAPLILERAEIDVEEAVGIATMHVRPLATTPAGRRFRTEFLMALSVQQSWRAGGRPQDLIDVGFAHAAPSDAAHLARYRATFGERLRFGQAGSWVRFPAALLDAPLAGHDLSVYEALRAPLQALMDQRLRDHDSLHTVRQAVREALPQVPDAQAMARQLGCSERTLRRQLHQRGHSYAALVQQCRRELAERLLREGRLPLKQIADAAGFSSSSCFHRAFRRWHGQTPSDWQVSQR